LTTTTAETTPQWREQGDYRLPFEDQTTASCAP
jgi:hypothetical protein